MPDPKQLLLGEGKATRHLPPESARRLGHPDVEALIAAAIEHVSVPSPAEGRGRIIVRTFGEKKRLGRKAKTAKTAKK